MVKTNVFLSDALVPILFSSRKRHFFVPFVHTSALQNIHFLDFNYALNGLVSITLLFSLRIPYLASPDVWAGREAGKSRSVCAAFGTSLVSSNQLAPPEAAVALLLFSDQSNTVIDSKIVPHTPLNSPDFNNHKSCSCQRLRWKLEPLQSPALLFRFSHELRGPTSTQTSRHQPSIVILLRQLVDVSHPQEIGSWSEKAL